MDAFWQLNGPLLTFYFTCHDSWASVKAEASPDLFLTPFFRWRAKLTQQVMMVTGSQGPCWTITWGILKHLFAMVSALLREEFTL